MRYGGDAITVGGQARALAFVPGTSRLVALGNEHTLRVWDLPEKKPLLDLRHAGLGAHQGLGFADKDTAVLHLGLGFARVRLSDGGRVEQIPAAPRPAGSRIEGVAIAPGGRFAITVETGADYVGTQHLTRFTLDGSAVATSLDWRPPSETLERLGIGDARGPNLHANFNASAIRENGSVVAIGALVHQHSRVWVLWRWNEHAVLQPVLRLPEESRRAFAANTHIHFVGSLHLYPSDRHAVICRGQMSVLDLTTAETVHTFEITGDELAGDTHVDAGALCDNGQHFAAATRSGVGLWDVASGDLKKARRFDEGVFVLAAAASDTAAMFACADDRGLVLQNLPDLTPAHSASGHRNPARVLALCPRGRHLASSDGSSLKMWHLASGELAWDSRHRAWASMVFSPDGERLFADGHLIEAATGTTLGTPGGSDGTAHAWSGEDGRLVHVGYREGETSGSVVHFYDGPEMSPTGETPEEYLRCVPTISANGKRAILASETVMYAFDMETRRRVWRREVDVAVSALSPDGAFVALTAIATDDVLLVDMETAEDITLPSGRGGLVQTIAFGAGDRIAIPADDHGNIAVLGFDRANPKRPVTRLELKRGHAAKVCGLAFGKDGTDLVSAAEDGSVCLWRLA